MNTELIGVIVTFILTVLLAIPLGKYAAKVFAGERTFLDFLSPLERFMYRICGIDPNKGMNWKEFLKAMLTINLVWFIYGFFMLLYQGHLPFNPDGNPDQTPDLAFNTVISFMVNCNLQHYSGETGATYLTQQFVFMFFQFTSAATGIACLVALFNGLKEKTTNNLGNFWVIFVRTITRILIPICIVIAVILAFNGTPTSYKGKDTITTLQHDTVQVSRGPVAGFVAIKHLGTNGGGWYGANSATRLKTPTISHQIERYCTGTIPFAMISHWILYKRRNCYCNFYSHDVGSLLVFQQWFQKLHGNPEIARWVTATYRRDGGKE
jgi:K+-transporting ATPase ATPase A chain